MSNSRSTEIQLQHEFTCKHATPDAGLNENAEKFDEIHICKSYKWNNSYQIEYKKQEYYK